MTEIGVQSLELCSPSYAEFKSLEDGKQVKKVLDDHGLKCPSAHFGLGALRNDQPRMIAWAQDIGMTQMSTASIGSGNGGNTPTLDQVKQAADEYNKIAAVAAKAGLQQALHNEGFENSTVDGRKTYDILLELLDPKLVKMQFQMSSMRVLGDPVEYSPSISRFISMHLRANLTPAAPTATGPLGAGHPPRAGGAAAGGRSRQGQPRLGQDLHPRRLGGVKNYFVEQNWDLTKEASRSQDLEGVSQ